MIKTVAAWAGLGVAAAILLGSLDVSTPVRVGLAAGWTVLAVPFAARSITRARARARREAA
jgi:hypothetical protein